MQFWIQQALCKRLKYSCLVEKLWKLEIIKQNERIDKLILHERLLEHEHRKLISNTFVILINSEFTHDLLAYSNDVILDKQWSDSLWVSQIKKLTDHFNNLRLVIFHVYQLEKAGQKWFNCDIIQRSLFLMLLSQNINHANFFAVCLWKNLILQRLWCNYYIRYSIFLLLRWF